MAKWRCEVQLSRTNATVLGGLRHRLGTCSVLASASGQLSSRVSSFLQPAPLQIQIAGIVPPIAAQPWQAQQLSKSAVALRPASTEVQLAAMQPVSACLLPALACSNPVPTQVTTIRVPAPPLAEDTSAAARLQLALVLQTGCWCGHSLMTRPMSHTTHWNLTLARLPSTISH